MQQCSIAVWCLQGSRRAKHDMNPGKEGWTKCLKLFETSSTGQVWSSGSWKIPPDPWNIPRPSTTSLWRKSFHINVFWGTCGVCQASVGIFLDTELRAKRWIPSFHQSIGWIDCHVQPSHEITNQIHMAYLRAWAAEGGGISSYPILAPVANPVHFCHMIVTCIFGADLTKVLATDGRSLMVCEVSCVDKVLIHQIQTEDALNRTCAHASIEGESMWILKYKPCWKTKTCSFCPRSRGDPTVDLKSHHYHLHALCVW